MKQLLQKESGVTLIELLATIVISSIVIGLVTSVLVSSLNFNDKTQSHINLRQEANIIITELRQQHQEGEYTLCPEDVFSSDRFRAVQRDIRNDEHMITSCNTVDSQFPLEVQFTLEDDENNDFTIDTIIEGERQNGDTNVSIDPPGDESDSFPTYVEDENVFVYGSQFTFQGSDVNGPGASMVIKGPLDMSEFNGGSKTNVSNIYVDGPIDFSGGGQDLGSYEEPGEIHINGDFDTGGGSHNIYGDVYVEEDFHLEGANIYGDVYVNGDVTLSDYYSIAKNASIHYTGSLPYPDHFERSDFDSLVKQESVPNAEIPDQEVPSSKSENWYAENGYTQEIQEDGMKIYDSDVVIEDNVNGSYQDTFTDSVVVSEGDITISGGNLSMTGVLYAPNGEITFEGASFEGTVIAKDGFNVDSGGTDITFVGVEEYINNRDDYPF
ncbi:prepilin-type N-terminal cleavage/methylation domain-containing protein [Salibacterium salarium]|uniref:Prepilin-type N-terminal cleavage/methylation domain-containing protein n=1 Tax=Salibacterium salarium TaxID=284579 RepID=A0A3R9P437_9BACI|nr:prepilin-type N-terminal cleavage/methylation domain-containing protein [Salibacterium salarium]RSL32378.1 prepilin-type N-terminal cleavage/methylation domain-containing protein [Salibacterium salarium]